mmetsp:Transcript_26305/g.37701  ORF Transcript_26305/g.37701 Transcript_26305/m.37701 type:complete len:124 (-) Transcript_26305:168-539(-)
MRLSLCKRRIALELCRSNHGAPLEIVKALVKADPDSVEEILSAHGSLLHLACESEFISSLEVIDFLAEAYPEAMNIKNDDDQMPSDIIRQGQRKEDSLPADLSVFSEHLEKLFRQAFPETYAA